MRRIARKNCARRIARARHLVAVVDADRRLGEQHLLRRHQVGLRRREHEDDAGRRQRAGDERRLQQRRHEDRHARQAAHELLVKHHEAAVAADADEVAAAARLQLVDGVAERRLEARRNGAGLRSVKRKSAHGGHTRLVLERRVVLEAAGHAGVLVVEEEDADGGPSHLNLRDVVCRRVSVLCVRVVPRVRSAAEGELVCKVCLLYTSPSPRDS